MTLSCRLSTLGLEFQFVFVRLLKISSHYMAYFFESVFGQETLNVGVDYHWPGSMLDIICGAYSMNSVYLVQFLSTIF